MMIPGVSFVVAIMNCHYDLPSGSVGRDFVNQLRIF